VSRAEALICNGCCVVGDVGREVVGLNNRVGDDTPTCCGSPSVTTGVVGA